MANSFRLGEGRIVSISLIFLFVSIALFSLLFEPYDLQVTKNRFDLGLLASNRTPIRIVFISDIHDAYYNPQYMDRVIAAVNAQGADLVLIGGDSSEPDMGDLSALDPLKELKSRYGTYAVLGNHDYGVGWSDYRFADSVQHKLQTLGINVLRNNNTQLPGHSGALALVGVDDLWAHKSDFRGAIAGLPDDESKIILVHNQMAIDRSELSGRDLILSGHTHCGQIRIPIITDLVVRALGFGDIVGGRKELSADDSVFLTCGIVPGGARFLAPPEISVIEIE